MDESEFIKRLRQFMERIARGDLMEVTNVSRIETPDGPATIFEKSYQEFRDGKFVEPEEGS